MRSRFCRSNTLTKARRPNNSSLENRCLDEQVSEYLPPWEQALKAYLLEKGYLSPNPPKG